MDVHQIAPDGVWQMLKMRWLSSPSALPRCEKVKSRQDLVRYNRFTSSDYVWQWKGGVHDGQGVEDYKNLYPIPVSDMMVNPNLEQNPGYNK